MYMRKIAVLLILTVTNSICHGIELPATWKYESKIDKHQYGYTTVSIKQNGTVNASTLFSNGKKIDGDHFVSQVAVYTRNNYPLLCLQYGGGLNPAGPGGAKERRVRKSASIDVNLVKYIERVGVSHSTKDVIPDDKFWKNVGRVSVVVVRAILQDPNAAQEALAAATKFIVDVNDVIQDSNKFGTPTCTGLSKAGLAKNSGGNQSTNTTRDVRPLSFKFYDEILCQTPSCDSWIVP